MKFFTATAFSGLVALVAAIPQSGSATTSIASATSTAPLSPTASCIAACQNDLTCKAGCVGVPAPNASMINDTTKCAAKCPQGSGTPADTEAYAKCQQGCISSLFLTATGTAAETGASSATATGGTEASTTDSSPGSASTGSSDSGSSSSGSGSSGSATSTSGSGSSSSSSTASGSAASTSHTGAASSHVQMGASAAGLMGIMLAALAL